jgi:lipoprotein-anchoring transpeptidase ErfK/SrfK
MMKRPLSMLILAGLGPLAGQVDSAQTPVVRVSTSLVTRTSHPITTVATNVPARTTSPRPAKKSPSLMETVTLQTALDRNGFGVGLIDGQAGSRSAQALHDYAQSTGLTDKEARASLLADTEPSTNAYTITVEDLAKVGTAPTDYEEASKVPAMACASMDEVLLEKFHVSRVFLGRLNPGITNWAGVTAGTSIMVPNSRTDEWTDDAARLEVDCSAYRIRAYDTNNTIIASFPCSIARKLNKVPVGDLTLVAFAPNPNYTFDPDNFPESPRAREIGKKLIIPPGPRNPVGVYWLSLSATGFGMHGTPHPETIGRRESHGCFRLTNWDITTLAGMVEAGTPVRVMNVPAEPAE